MSFIVARAPAAAFAPHSGDQSARLAKPVFRILCCIIFLLALAGCQVQLVSAYDETTDSLARGLQTKIDRQFQSWIRMPAGSAGLRYDDKNNRDSYSDVSADLSVLESRAKAQPLNQTTVSMIETIRDSMDKLEAFHKTNGTISVAALGNAQGQIDFQLQRLVAFEAGKKERRDAEELTANLRPAV